MERTVYKKGVSLILLLIALLLIYNPLTKFPFTFCVIIAFILLSTYMFTGSLKSLNFKRIGFKELKVIVFAYLAIELLMDFVFQPVANRLFSEPADYSAFQFLEGDANQYLIWLCKMWISAAIGEELLFRTFAFANLKTLFGGNRWFFIPISAALFSLPHLYQGASGVFMTFLFGLAFGYLYYRYQNTLINIIVHGLIDTVFLTSSYFGLLEFYAFAW